jgi:hypothetical protein
VENLRGRDQLVTLGGGSRDSGSSRVAADVALYSAIMFSSPFRNHFLDKRTRVLVVLVAALVAGTDLGDVSEKTEAGHRPWRYRQIRN